MDDDAKCQCLKGKTKKNLIIRKPNPPGRPTNPEMNQNQSQTKPTPPNMSLPK
jgi:hypothetical protein